jgi:lipoprotein-anchoring transpeptidase ErfK/SrfK
MMASRITRRGFLKAASAAGAGAALIAAGGNARSVFAQTATTDPESELDSYNVKFNYPPLLGRVDGASWIGLYQTPSPEKRAGPQLNWGEVIPIYQGVRTVTYDSKTPHNDVWFETDGGWVHSAYVIPCREVLNEPEAEVPTFDGFWAELTVPRARQHLQPSLTSVHYSQYEYSCFWQQVYKVTEKAVDERGLVWYKIYDDREERRKAWILARNLRRIRPEEFAPISPDVTDKKLEIDLNEQMLTCYEGDHIVLQTRIASGTTLMGDDGTLRDFSTPVGEYRVQRKRPARRMQGGGIIEAKYDVAAVPWCTYFTDTGAAIHGSYWRNNYGYPKSHGCINVTPDAARWIYRWTQPYLSHLDDFHTVGREETATPIVIV